MKRTRRKFIKQSGRIALGLGVLGWTACGTENNSETTNNEDTAATTTTTPETTAEMFFKISLAQWSLHKAHGFGAKPTMDNLDFAYKAKNDYGIEAIEYVSQFFKDKAKDMEYLKEMNKRAADNGVKQLLIMIDREGNLAETDDKTRKEAVENHYKWVEAAKFLGCHSIRVNAATNSDSMEDAAKAAVDGLGSLATFAKQAGLNVIVENHGGFSSNGAWLAGVMSQINMDNCGTLPDFGNFCIERTDDGCANEYDRYTGITELMPFAKAVSAKSHDFNADGDEIHSDYTRILKIVKDAGYKGYIGIEYEGSSMTEAEGIMATKRLLEKVGKAMG